MKRIPLYTIEEHHQAFYIWNKAIEDKIIPPCGLTLLHVDHHPDMEYGAYRGGLGALFGSLEEKRAFTYHSLGIADFIYPAIYEGIFSELVYVHNFLPILGPSEQRYISCKSDGGLMVEKLTPLLRRAILAQEADQRFFAYQEGGLGEFHPVQPVVLDIDLDYFCWDDSLSTAEVKKMEITPEAYDEFVQNPLHPFRILPRALLEVQKEGKRCYLYYRESLNPEPIPAWEVVEKRIDRLISWLGKCLFRPIMIDICRSCHSGYMPLPMWKQVETDFLKKLEGVYAYDRKS